MMIKQLSFLVFPVILRRKLNHYYLLDSNSLLLPLYTHAAPLPRHQAYLNIFQLFIHPLALSYSSHPLISLSPLCIFFSMDNLWFPPPSGVVKINVHAVYTEEPLLNGKSNSLGIIARDHDGKILWGVMGPLVGFEGL